MTLFNKIRRARAGLLAFVWVAAFVACTKQGEQSTAAQYVEDAAMTAKVRADFIQYDIVQANEIQAETIAGVVKLTGIVISDDARPRAGQLAPSSDGAKSNRNELTVQASQQTAAISSDDAIITTKVKAALLGDDDVKGLSIDVQTTGGIVQLIGAARSNSEREIAEQLTEAIDGVTSVQNLIAVN